MNSKFFALCALFSGMVCSSNAQLVFSNITTTVSASPTNLNAVVLGGTTASSVVAVGDNSAFARTLSPDLIGGSLSDPGWSAANGFSNGYSLKAVTYGNGTFAAAGSNNVVFTSANGAAPWNSVSKVFTNGVEVDGLGFDGNTFVAAPASFQLSYAGGNLANWTIGSNATPYVYAFLESFRAVTSFGASNFAAVGAQGVIRISTNAGRTWYVVIGVTNTFSRPNLLGIASDNTNTLVAVGTNGTILRSVNGGLSWATNTPALLPNRVLQAVSYLNPGFIAVGSDGTNELVLTSSDGSTWTTNSTLLVPARARLRGVSFATSGPLRDVGVAVGEQGTVLLGGYLPPRPESLGDRTNCVPFFTSAACVSVTNDAILTVDWFTNETRVPNELPVPNGQGTNCLIPQITPENTTVGEHRYYAETRDRRTGFHSTTRTRVSLWVDPEPPKAIFTDLTVYLNAVGLVSITASNVAFASTDNCDITNMVAFPTNFTCANVGTNLVRLIVTDSAGNRDTNSGTVTVVDNLPPIPNCPANIVQTNDLGQCSASVVFAATPTDNCGVLSTIYRTNGVTITSPWVFPVGMTTVDVAVADINGNNTNCSFTVTVNDTELPVPNCPANIVQTNDLGQCAASVAFAAAPTDNCGVLSTVYTTNGVAITSPWVFPVGTTTVTVTVADIHNNTNACNFTVTINDTEKPAITCPANIAVVNALGQCGSNVTFTVTATDNCGVSNIVSTPPGGFAFPVGVTTVTNVATDIHGNTNVCYFTVTVNDTEQPAITCPANIVVVNALGQCGSNVTFLVTATDNCAVSNIVSTPPSGFAFPVGVTTVTNVVTDIHNNTNVCYFTVRVNDTELPVPNCPANIVRTNDAGQCAASVAFAATPTDNCGVLSTVYTTNGVAIASPWVFPVGTTTVTVTVADIHGNTNTCNFTVQVNDTEKPVVNCPANIVRTNDLGQCAASVPFAAAPTDNCGVLSTVYTTNGVAIASPWVFPVGTTTVTVAVADIHNNTNTCSFTVTVNDTEKPVVNCPANIVRTNDLGQCAASVPFAATPTDNCGVLSTVYRTNGVAITSPWVFPVGTTTVTVTVADIHGNTNTCNFNVTVNDTELPVVNCPANIVRTNDLGQCAASVPFAATPTDNCGVLSTVYRTNGVAITSPWVFPVGTTTVTVTVADIHNNTNTCNFTVTVNDTEKPVVNCPANIVRTNDLGQCAASVPFAAAPTDNCGVLSTVYTTNGVAITSPWVFPVGTTTVTVTVADIHNNTNTCNFTVTVNDTEKPVVNCPVNIVRTNDASQCSASIAFAAAPTDNCGVLSTVYTTNGVAITSPWVFPVGTTTVTVTVADIHNNTNTCNFTVQVNDTEKPVVNCPANIVRTNDLGQCAASVPFAAAPTDNCGVLSTVYTTNGVAITSPWVFPVGTTTVTVTVADIHNNTNTCNFTVTVNDTELPVPNCPVNIVRTNDASQCSASIAFAAAPTDNCGVLSTNYMTNGVAITSPWVFPVGTTTVTVTVADIHNNTNTCNFTVTVNDTEKPAITCPADIVVATVPGLCDSNVTFTVTATDNCGVLSTNYTINGAPITSPYVFPMGTTTVDVTVADINNNTNTCSFKVVVQPRLVINLVGTDLILTWCGNSTLQSASVLTNIIWTNVPGATSPYTNSIIGAEAYFRLSPAP